MPWGDNTKGQGPWGQGPKKPGNNGQKNQENVQDLDEWIKKNKDRFDGFFGGGSDGSGRSLGIVLLIALLLWLGTGVYTVAPEEQGIVTRFGAYHRWAGPGLHYHLPMPAERVIKVPVTTVNRVEVGVRSVSTGAQTRERKVLEESLMLTGDENIVDVDFEVQWRIRDAKEFLFEIKDPAGTVKAAAESAMREVIGRTPIADALTDGRLQIEQEAMMIIQSMLDKYNAGVEIVRLQLREVQPPQQVINAFRDVQNAKTDKESAINQAEAYRNDIIPRARGDAERILQEAEAYREEKIRLSAGEADRFVKVYDEFRKAKTVTKQRMYLETMEEILSGVDKVILDTGEQGVLPYLPVNELKKK